MKSILLPILLTIFLVFTVSCQGPYKDGIYEGKSRARYIYEPYVGMVKVEIKGGYFKTIEFTIADTLNNEIFDGEYEKHYIGNELYIQQCRDDWKGVQNYPKKLLKIQNIEKVDVISGATWSYNIFKASLLEALKETE